MWSAITAWLIGHQKVNRVEINFIYHRINVNILFPWFIFQYSATWKWTTQSHSTLTASARMSWRKKRKMMDQLWSDFVRNAATIRCHMLHCNYGVPTKGRLCFIHARIASKYRKRWIYLNGMLGSFTNSNLFTFSDSRKLKIPKKVQSARDCFTLLVNIRQIMLMLETMEKYISQPKISPLRFFYSVHSSKNANIFHIYCNDFCFQLFLRCWIENDGKFFITSKEN